jgi:hypothetical protein
MKGRRLPIVDGKPTWPTEPVGPVMGYTGDKPAVFFLKPHARNEGTPPHGRAVQHVCLPPHSATEEEDGTLTIGDTRGDGSEGSDGWHGYLTEGVWTLV